MTGPVATTAGNGGASQPFGGSSTTAVRPSNASWLAAFLRRDWNIARSYRLQFVLDLATIPLSLALFFFLSRLVDTSGLPTEGDMQQGYFAFAAVGIAVLRMVQMALTSFSVKLRNEQTTGTFEALLASPVTPSVVVLGSAAFEILRATAIGCVTLGVALLFGVRFNVSPTSVVGVLLGLPALIATFAAVGVAVAACAVIFKQITALLGLIATGLALLTGVYFPTNVLPGPLEVIAEALPLTWGIDVLRAALLQGELAGTRLGMLVGFAVVALPVSLWLFRVSIDHARRRGTLTQF
jgi:ABC-2 type transport system permease protein